MQYVSVAIVDQLLQSLEDLIADFRLVRQCEPRDIGAARCTCDVCKAEDRVAQLRRLLNAAAPDDRRVGAPESARQFGRPVRPPAPHGRA